ncbi:MAG: GGDEF domain-containing protein, partial [Desulfovibrionaceae bacterium]
MILMDVDLFRAYNEAYGHGHGDTCLKQLARSAKGALRRSGDFVARYGGEAFAVLLPETGPAEAQAMAQQILEGVDQLTIPHEGSPTGKVTVSLGVATVRPDESLDAPSLVRAASQALAEAKEAGRHCVRSVEL